LGTAVQPGTIIEGKYRVLRRIGEGGMGTVYEGENVRIERRVAIKVLHEHVASSQEFAQRFEREARACARVGSPHVCDVLDLGDLENGEKFLVMEFLEGESLEERLTTKGRLTPYELAPIAFEILEGLGAMHQAGVIHRDLKPANVFLARRSGGRAETVKILDFGVAKIIPRADDPGGMTSTGVMMGTPLYMSPEQARGARDVDGRTDLYAASVIFYRALTGEMPHIAANLHELLFKIVLEEPRPIRELSPEVDEVFASIVMKGLARDAEQRYASAREYQEAIAEWGRAQGRASLLFTVTLPSEPPPLRNISGGYPVAAIAQSGSITDQKEPPKKDPVDRTGPPTPALALAKTLASSGRLPPAGPPTPAAVKQSGGTPIVWSEDASEIAKKAFAELEEKKKAEAAEGGTEEAQPESTEEAASSEARAASPPPAGARPQGRMGAAIGVGAVGLAIVAAIVGGRLAGQPASAGADGPASAVPAAASEAELPSETAPAATTSPPPTTAVDEPAAASTPAASASGAPPVTEPSAQPAASASASAKAPPRPTPPVGVAAAQPAPRTSAKPAASASAAASTTPAASTPPVTSPAPTTTSGRKFRTRLD